MNTFNQVPAYLAGRTNRTDALSGMIAGLGVSRGPHVSLRGGKFRLVNAVGVESPVSLILDVIIIGAQYNASRIFYSGAYDENNPTPPVCWSDNGTGPSDRKWRRECAFGQGTQGVVSSRRQALNCATTDCRPRITQQVP